MLGSLGEGIQVLDREWRYVYLDKAAGEHGRCEAAALIGTSRELLVGLRWIFPLWHPPRAALLMARRAGTGSGRGLRERNFGIRPFGVGVG